jgi:hypothetical protein
MPEATHIYTGPTGGSVTVNGRRLRVSPGDRVPFGPSDIDARARERIGEFFVPLGEYDGPVAESPTEGGQDGPAWALLSISDLAELAEGFEAFSKSGLVALCEYGGLDSSGGVSELRARLFDSLDAYGADGADEDEDEFSTLDDLDKMDPEFGLSPEAD